MATLRAWLKSEGFPHTAPDAWIVYQAPGDNPNAWRPLLPPAQIHWDHPVLDQEFDDGYGGREAPYIVAGDHRSVYVIVQYDGATSLHRISTDLLEYLSGREVPDLGGG